MLWRLLSSLRETLLVARTGAGAAVRNRAEIPDGPDFDLDTEFLASHAHQLANDLNGALRRANESAVPAARRSQLLVARERLRKLKEIAEGNPTLKLQNLPAVEQCIVQIEKETDDLDPPRKPDEFLKVSLLDQCRMLNVPLERLELERDGKNWLLEGNLHTRPEPAVLAHFEQQGFIGACCEGTAPLMLMKSACLDYLASVNTFGSRSDACTRYFEAQCFIHADRAAEIIDAVGSANEATIRRNLKEILTQPTYAALYAPVQEESMIAIWKALRSEGLCKLTERLLEDPYGRRSGWPDLTLARGSEVLFVEVKTTDRLHASQRSLIEGVLIPFGADVRVVQVCRSR